MVEEPRLDDACPCLLHPRMQPAKRPAGRSQIALWMLTKFAMIFFIGALALILLGMSSREQSGLCDEQAGRVTSSVSGALVQVLSSPIEDERKVYPFETSLSVGRSDFELYTVNITKHTVGDARSIVIDVLPRSPTCKASGSIGIDSDVVVHFSGPRRYDTPEGPCLTLEPSSAKQRSYYLVVIKCSTKRWPAEQHVYLDDCTFNNPAECITLETESIAACCGWTQSASTGSQAEPQCEAEIE
ncbi:hypothetical protein COT29_02415 [Candidatus Micrarchaeota archaeon CG08_land_8_20_14_0_20_59_11]|nr:MAG: hypothetical protein COT29_02415 [Candidatus Micrarchaeota archaeon CG08_land_8_20_14_0_20_59_11]